MSNPATAMGNKPTGVSTEKRPPTLSGMMNDLYPSLSAVTRAAPFRASVTATITFLADRYASFDGGKGKDFEEGKLSLEDLVAYAKANGEPKQTSGKQELYEAIVNMYC